MASYECYECADVFPVAEITERICCRRRLCSDCLKDSPKCRHCADDSNVPRIEVDLEQLNEEIQRCTEILQEQTEFYRPYLFRDSNDKQLVAVRVAAKADAKAIQLHLELLYDLQERLSDKQHGGNTGTSVKTVLIPQGIFVRSTDSDENGRLIENPGLIRARDYQHLRFLESHKIYHSWYGGTPMGGNYLKKLKVDSEEWNIVPLKYMPVESLSLSNSKVTDLTALTGLPSQTLTNLYAGYTDIIDLSPLAGCKALRVLELFGSKVTDLSPLKGLALTRLNIRYTKVTDLSPVADIVGLEIIQ